MDLNLATTAEVARALRMDERSVRRKGITEGWWFRDSKTRGRLWVVKKLPMEVQVGLAMNFEVPKAPGIPERPKPERFLTTTDRNRDVAIMRSSLIRTYEQTFLSPQDFVEAFNRGSISKALKDYFGDLKVSTFYRYLHAYRELGTDGVTPKWGEKKRGGFGARSLSEVERQLLLAYYLDPRKWTINHCYLLLAEWLPVKASVATARRFLRSLPKPYVDYYRLGVTKFSSLHQPFIEREPERYLSLDQCVSDHHNWDFLVKKEGQIFRPWVTVFQDYRSRKIVGWAPSVYPSSVSIILAYYVTVLRYGVPKAVHIDNGKDYRSRILNGTTQAMKVVNEQGIEEELLVKIQGIFDACGSEVMFAAPYHAQSKGATERTFGTYAEYFAKDFETYVGSNTVTRPEEAALYWRRIGKHGKKDVLVTWEEYVRGFDAFVAWWNKHWKHSGRGMDGKTPDEVFEANKQPLKTVTPDLLEMIFGKPEVRRVRENGVSLDGVFYWAPELFEYAGRDVIAKRMLSDFDTVIVTDERGAFLCKARANWFAETGDLAGDTKKVNEARKRNLAKIREFSSGVPKLPGAKRSLVAKVLEEESGNVRSDLDILLVANGGYEEAPKPERKVSGIISPLEYVEDASPRKQPELKSALDI